jgi:tRNA threonylcarbamoyl adenosine modification protein (Sua5/YciO/YrdC/YwlC family)
MAQYFQIHPTHPQLRLIKRAVDIVRAGGVIAYPTDSSYALGCHIGDKEAMERIRRIRRVDDNHNFTLVCRDLSEVAQYARVSNADYRRSRPIRPGRILSYCRPRARYRAACSIPGVKPRIARARPCHCPALPN